MITSGTLGSLRPEGLGRSNERSEVMPNLWFAELDECGVGSSTGGRDPEKAIWGAGGREVLTHVPS